MDRKHEKEGNSIKRGSLLDASGDDPGRFGDAKSWDMGSRNRNLRRCMIEQFEFEFVRALHDLQLKETIQKADVEALVVRLTRGVGELAVQNQSIICEEMAIREKSTRNSLNLD
jgi:hypothetical protein